MSSIDNLGDNYIQNNSSNQTIFKVFFMYKEIINTDLIACHECDKLLYRIEIPEHTKALCNRCGALLYRHIPNSLDRSLALHIAAIMVFCIANLLPFISLKSSGLENQSILISSGLAMFDFGMGEIGLVIFATSILFPFITMLGTLYLLLFSRFNTQPPLVGIVFRTIKFLTPWSLVGVFMLGVLIAIVKLQDLATVVPGISLFAFATYIVIYTAARATFHADDIWINSEHSPPNTEIDHSEHIWTHCHYCQLLVDENEHQVCPRCDANLHKRKPNSIKRTWALLFTAMILILPANLYPVMTVMQFGKGEPNTIMSGVIHLIQGGMWGLAMIVFIASIVVPVLKLIALSYLLLSVQNQSDKRPEERTRLYRITEIVGAWSMVDIYLVGLLSALVSLGSLSTIEPNIGATFFAAVVIITMLAAHSFDPRLIWDAAGLNNKNKI